VLQSAQPQAATTHAGDTVDVVVSAEGDTTVTDVARDTAGRVGDAAEVTVRLDKTGPLVTANLSPEPNGHGWNDGDVTVSFLAVDELSGVDVVEPAVLLAEEGAGQEVVGTAMDLAGNVAPAVVAVNIDRTPPVLHGLPAPSCLLWPPRHQLVQVAAITASDALSGIAPAALLVSATSNEPEIGTRPAIDMRPTWTSPTGSCSCGRSSAG
jgi:hypothetical protein